MSILHRTAYLTLSALLAIVPAACGGDDDDDTADDTADDTSDDTSDDDGDAPDAGDETPDAGTPDAGDVTPDAAVLEGDQYLMGIDLSVTGTPFGDLAGVTRIIATVALDGASATFQLQPIVAPECAKGAPAGSGEPTGEPELVEDVAIAKDGSFEFSLEPAEFPAYTSGIEPACTLAIQANLTVTGSVAGGAPCGTIEGELVGIAGDVSATFGAVEIEPGTVGDDNLPEAVLDCPPAIR